MQRIHFNFDYLADRYHLRKYGRLITNDSYFAMSYGPVPSGVKDIAEASDFLGESENKYSSRFVESIENLTLKSINPVDDSVFSESDIEALTFAWEKFGRLDQFKLAELTHYYPEWEKHKKALELDSRIQMNLEDFLNDSTSNIEKCYELTEQDRSIRREQLEELFHIESLWS